MYKGLKSGIPESEFNRSFEDFSEEGSTIGTDSIKLGLIVAKSLDIEYSINDLKVYFSAVDDDLKEVVKDIIGDCEIEEIKLS